MSTESYNKTRAAFMLRALAPHVLPHAFKLAYLICYKYMNRETRTARPAQETLARDLNVSDRTVRRLADVLKPLGLTVVPGHGPNQANSYWIEPEKATRASPIEPKKRTPVSSINRTPVSSIKRK